MKKAMIEIDWAGTDLSAGFAAPIRIAGVPGRETNRSASTGRFSPGAGSLRCPNCKSIIYSRRSKLCGVCTYPLPQAFLFSPMEADRIESLLARERERHKQWVHRLARAN